MVDWCEFFYYEPDTGLLKNRKTRSSKAICGSVAGGLNTVSGYHMVMLNRRKYYTHRIVWELLNPLDRLLPGDEVDHINGLKHDNRACNLRKVNHTDNQKNRPINKNNKTGAMGVYLEKRTGKWVARIVIDRVTMHLGTFIEFDDAVAARKAAELEYGFHQNHGRSNAKNS